MKHPRFFKPCDSFGYHLSSDAVRTMDFHVKAWAYQQLLGQLVDCGCDLCVQLLASARYALAHYAGSRDRVLERSLLISDSIDSVANAHIHFLGGCDA